MKDEDHIDAEFEQLLRDRLKPKDPTWECNRNILESILLKDEKSLNQKRRKEWFRNYWLGASGIAAILLLTFVFFISQNSTITPAHDSEENEQVAASYRAVGAKQKLIGVEDMGWSEGDNDQITREFKYDYVDTVDLVNDEDGSVMRLQVPRQEIINVTYQVI